MSDIVAVPLRGGWTGNRGCLHRGHEIVRPSASHHWLVCALQYKQWHQTQWLPNRLTWLFFHDEAVALAAGHRPCALCRRSSYNDFRDLFSRPGPRRSFDEMDRQLHRERRRPYSRTRTLHDMAWPQLPDGTFVVHDGRPRLVIGRELVAWGTTGYGERRSRPTAGTAQLITPPSTVRVLQAGYPIQIDRTALVPATTPWKGLRAHLVSVRSWFAARSASDHGMRAGDIITAPDGSRHVLPKAWADMTKEDLAAIGIRPGSAPSFFTPFHDPDQRRRGRGAS